MWAAQPFFPYKQGNPKSSNPYEMYGDLFQPWIDADPFDRFVNSLRTSLRQGVIAMSSHLTPSVTRRLKKICLKADPELFYPMVYRIDISKIEARRLDKTAG